ncbi:MAG: thiolase C-terminal domain-containing protein [Candidatus Binataceae bacterium]
MWSGRGKTAIVGIGYSEITRRPQKPLGLLAVDACRAAIADAGLDPAQIDGLATYPESPFAGAGNRDGEEVVSVMYLVNHLVLAREIRWYAQIETGMIASPVIEAVHAIIAEACEYVLIWRALHRPAVRAARLRGGGAPSWMGDAQFMAPYGCNTIIQWHALAWQQYMHRYGATGEALAALALNSRRNANLNPRAFFYQEPMSRADYFASRWIAEPLRLFDCDVPVDGCVAIVVTSAERARDLRHPPAYIAGYGQNTAPQRALIHYALGDYMECGASLARKLWSSAGAGPGEMDAAQLYDGFNPSTLYWLEAAGFCGRGEGGAFVQDGRIALEGELPVNTFGGSLSEGRMHGMGHIAEAVRQVTGRAEQRQIAGAELVCAIDGSPMLRGSGIVVAKHPS